MIVASVLLFFIDGLGIGKREETNPLAKIKNIEPLAHFQNEKSEIIFDGVLTATDARLVLLFFIDGLGIGKREVWRSLRNIKYI